MEEKDKNLPKEEHKPSPDNKETVTQNLEENKEIGIEPKTVGLDKDSSTQTTLLSNIKLSNEQKEEVKSLLKEELNTSVQTLKNEVKNEGQEIKKDFLTIFGLFASFVTFLSIEVQVFKNKDNVLELIGISSISLSFVMFFALVINDIAKDKSEWKDFKKPTYIFNLLFALVGMLFLYIGGTSSINRIDSIEKQSKSDNTEIQLLKSSIQQLNNKIQYLDSLTKGIITNKTPAQAKPNDKPQ